MKGNICKYFEECVTTKSSGRDCANPDTCQTRKFYDRIWFRLFEFRSWGYDDTSWIRG